MWIENLRGAFRSLRSTPGFSVTAILSLAIGIGGSVSMFTVVNSILLKPLEYPDSGRLVRVKNADTRNDSGANGLLPLHGLPREPIAYLNQSPRSRSAAFCSISRTIWFASRTQTVDDPFLRCPVTR